MPSSLRRFSALMTQERYLAGVHQVVRVEYLLDVAHQVQDVIAQLHAHRADLAHAHAVLAGAGAFQAQRALDQALVERLGELGLLRLLRVDQEHEVEVAVADVAEERHRRDVALHVLHGFVHAFGEARDRHAYGGRDRARAGAQLQAGEVGVVPRLPELAALLGLRRPDKIHAAVLLGDRLHRFGLFHYGVFRSMKFEENGGCDAVARLLEVVDRAYRLVAHDVAARDRDAGLDGFDHGARAAVDRVEGTHGRRHRLLHRVQPHRHLGNDAQRSLGADEEPCQVVTRGRLLRATRGLDDAAVGEHYF